MRLTSLVVALLVLAVLAGALRQPNPGPLTAGDCRHPPTTTASGWRIATCFHAVSRQRRFQRDAWSSLRDFFMDQGRNAFGLFVLLGQERRAARRPPVLARRVLRAEYAIALVPPGPQQTLCGGHRRLLSGVDIESVTFEASRVSVHDLGERQRAVLLEPATHGSAAWRRRLALVARHRVALETVGARAGGPWPLPGRSRRAARAALRDSRS